MTNRQPSLVTEAVAQPEPLFRVDVSRPDGRPEAYDAPKGSTGLTCILCVEENKFGVRYNAGEIFMCSPADSSDGQAHLVCMGHVPENIVIYNPETGLCRSKDGSDVWRENEPGMSRPFQKTAP